MTPPAVLSTQPSPRQRRGRWCRSFGRLGPVNTPNRFSISPHGFSPIAPTSARRSIAPDELTDVVVSHGLSLTAGGRAYGIYHRPGKFLVSGARSWVQRDGFAGVGSNIFSLWKTQQFSNGRGILMASAPAQHAGRSLQAEGNNNEGCTCCEFGARFENSGASNSYGSVFTRGRAFIAEVENCIASTRARDSTPRASSPHAELNLDGADLRRTRKECSMVLCCNPSLRVFHHRDAPRPVEQAARPFALQQPVRKILVNTIPRFSAQ